MSNTDRDKEFDLLKEKFSRHEKILIQAYKSLKQKEFELKSLNDDLLSSEEELRQTNDMLQSVNEQLYNKNAALNTALKNLKTTQLQLIQAEKMASMAILLSGIAHEINNPLNFIMGGLVGLENYFTENNIQNDDVKIFLNSITEGLDRATGIICELSQFKTDNFLEKEKCDINTVIDNCLEMLQNQLLNKIVIEKDYTASKLIVEGNTSKLSQIFDNLLSNAIQAIDKNGTIVIKTQKIKQKAIIAITDNGCGISDDHISKIIDPFFTTKDPGKGVGLGLAITYSILEQYKGKLDFKSKPNRGTSVKVTLPLIQKG